MNRVHDYDFFVFTQVVSYVLMYLIGIIKSVCALVPHNLCGGFYPTDEMNGGFNRE